MRPVRYDRYYTYEELSDTLLAWADEAPRLCRVESIGRSYEGRDIWLAIVTNFDTGPDHEKPALLVEANIHSVEVTGCTAALHLVHKLLSEHDRDEKVTRALDTRTFYVVPRLNPDGAELALAERPRYVRSSVRRYPCPSPRTASTGRIWTATDASSRCASRIRTATGRSIPRTSG
jgi:murein tripeptide amidase MpaA